MISLKSLQNFPYSSEAQIIKGRLEADGIPVFLSDNITIDTDPLVSQAIGGVKLKVLAKDAMKAQHILSTLEKYSLDDAGNAISCPNCKNEKIEMFSTIKDIKSFFSFIFGFLFGTLPFYAKHKYKCEDCNTEFDLK